MFKHDKLDTDCLNGNLFIQYTCEMDAETKEHKEKDIKKITAAVLFITFVYLGMIYYLQTTSK